MNRYALTIMAVSLTSSGVWAGSNCQHSSSWQCQQLPQGSGTTMTQPQTYLPPTTTQVGGKTPVVGSLPPGPQVVVLKPLPPQTFSGYGKPPPVTSTQGPGFTGSRPPIVVTGSTYTVVGYGQPPQITTIPTPSFTGTGTQPIVVTGTQGPPIVGYGPVNPPQGTPGPGVTGTGNPPIVVTGTQGPPIVGYGPVNPPKGTTGPGVTGTGNPPIVVTGTQGPPIIGYAPVNPPQGTPGPGVTGTGNPPIVVTGTLGPPIVGYGPVSPPQGTPGAGGAGPGNPPQGSLPYAGHLAGTLPNQGGGKTPTHVLVVHEPPRERPVTSGDHESHHPYSLEFIEPGIQNHKVEVYRSKDAQQVTYRDINPLDAGGFHLKVIGTRNPDYVH